MVRAHQLQHQQHGQELTQQSTRAIAKIRKSNDENVPWFQQIKEWHCTQLQKEREQ